MVLLDGHAQIKQAHDDYRQDENHARAPAEELHIPTHALRFPSQVREDEASGRSASPLANTGRSIASSTYGLTKSGHPLPHPDWQRLHGPDAIPNQHGHVLLKQYTQKPIAAGCGYGPKHKAYYQYRSLYTQEVTTEPEEQDKIDPKAFRPKKCPTEYAHGMGYGSAHEVHHWYIAPKTQNDL